MRRNDKNCVLFFSDCAVKLVISLLYTYIYINRYRYLYIYIYRLHDTQLIFWFYGEPGISRLKPWQFPLIGFIRRSVTSFGILWVIPSWIINTPQSKSWFCDRFFLRAQSWDLIFLANGNYFCWFPLAQNSTVRSGGPRTELWLSGSWRSFNGKETHGIAIARKLIAKTSSQSCKQCHIIPS